MIIIKSRRSNIAKLQQKFPNAYIVDTTSKAAQPFVQLSPFYPHGKIPIPFSEGHFSKSLEGIWQGLKVFEEVGIDTAKFENDKMKGLKRTVRKFGVPKGHQKGIESKVLLKYIEARKLIFVPTYKWILENKAQEAILKLQAMMKEKDLVLLDYETNGVIENPNKPLSHAYLVKYFLENSL